MRDWSKETNYGSPERIKVLVYGKIGPGVRMTIAQRVGHDWLDETGAWFPVASITHWMPLPEPPKEGSE